MFLRGKAPFFPQGYRLGLDSPGEALKRTDRDHEYNQLHLSNSDLLAETSLSSPIELCFRPKILFSSKDTGQAQIAPEKLLGVRTEIMNIISYF